MDDWDPQYGYWSFGGYGLVPDQSLWYSWQAGYTFVDSKDNSSYSCCISSTAQFETPVSGGPNDLGDPGDEDTGTWGPSDFSRPHTFVLSGVANLPAGFAVSGIWRASSGRPWTPVVDGDANGDAQFNNDRAFIGSGLNLDNPAVDHPLLDSIIGAHSCLAEQAGGIARRNSCRNSMYTQLDLRFRWSRQIRGNHRLEIVADVFNVLNFINKDWSRNVGVTQFGDGRNLLEVESFDPATNTYIYSVNPSFAEEEDLTAFRTDQGTLQLGVKYAF